MTADRKQVGGTHYADLAIQPWHAIQAWGGSDAFAAFLWATAIAYLARFHADAPGKGGLQDVQKAIHTLTKLEEVLLDAAR